MPESSPGAREALQSLPSVDDLLKNYPPEKYRVPRNLALTAIRKILTDARQQIQQDKVAVPAKSVRLAVKEKLEQLAKPRLRPVLNGTGVVLHTGLGRAPLSSEVIDRAFCSLSNYSSLELDLASGKRGERLRVVSELIQALVPTEGVMVVNNNAAAVLLMINTVAEGKEVIISRGQQVEIGGSFRMPDVIKKAGAHLVEVGTTNRTHLSDYEDAITSETGALLFVHTSNYRVEGFAKFVPPDDLAKLAKRKRLPLLVDLGSGSLCHQPLVDGMMEPSVPQMLKAGSNLVSFSGDKLLGGPQTGLVVGQEKWLKRLHRNPLYRTMRCDKVTFALLEQTLRTYSDPESHSSENMALNLLNRTRDELRSQADMVVKDLSLQGGSKIRIVESIVEAGSGSLPGVKIPSIALAISKINTSPDELALEFRHAMYPIVGYVRRGQYFIDLKAIPIEKSDILVRTLEEVLDPQRDEKTESVT
ncbi:L-seryl-tRNA(Sec) selenium transferase [Candidatus Neomarinimicrobiota bacterium]